jgi:hypothetical protein
MPMPKLTPGLVHLFSTLLQLAAHVLGEYESPEPDSRSSSYFSGIEDDADHDTDPVLPAIKSTQALTEI